MSIPFNKPHLTGNELTYIAQAHASGRLSGGGQFTQSCQAWLQKQLGTTRALLTPSGTAALELAAHLAGIRPGDEIILPSYTFVSTANAFVLLGAVPVFVDIRADTLNLDERLVEAALTPRTRAIVPVHYAGVGCEMPVLQALAARHGLCVIEDAAQAIGARYGTQALGTWGDYGALSFHETKNLQCGEGGALLIRDPENILRAEILQEKGTNRAQFFRGEIDKYTWVDLGSSYLASEITAAFLWAQLQSETDILARRQRLWNRYHEAFADLEASGRVRRPTLPSHCRGNAHLYHLLLEDLEDRTRFIERLRHRGIQCVFHYVPLHHSPAGRRFGRYPAPLPVTENAADRLVRLPLWLGLESEQEWVIDEARKALRS